MEKRCEQLYISPVECAATTDTAAIQAAVAKAKQLLADAGYQDGFSFTLKVPSAKARMALFCLSSGMSVPTTAAPIIGPPEIILNGSALKPPQKSIIS